MNPTELVEAITHLAFYAGWPKAMSAMAVAKHVFAPPSTDTAVQPAPNIDNDCL